MDIKINTPKTLFLVVRKDNFRIVMGVCNTLSDAVNFIENTRLNEKFKVLQCTAMEVYSDLD